MDETPLGERAPRLIAPSEFAAMLEVTEAIQGGLVPLAEVLGAAGA